VKLIEVPAVYFDLATTLNSGQVFHWEKVGDGFCGTIGDRAAYVEQCGDVLRVKVASASSRCLKKHAQDAHATISRYFALDHPLDEICASFPRDPAMNAARDFCRGLRIIRQPKWECLATFICSSMKQVTHIRQIVRALRQRFGEKKEICGYEVFSFPVPGRVARTSESELRKCGLGYRAKNLLATAKRVAPGEADLDSWSALSDGKLRERLCKLPGVGGKIANCVMLFAYERIAAFPIDVWIERVLREKYFTRRQKVTAQVMAEFAANYFGAYGGYAQQYLFHHARMTEKRRGKDKPEKSAHDTSSVTDM
jgi:N-glycosylase/DNA lyase